MVSDFIIIGAMKAGTSSLYHYVGSHPDVVASEPKETQFFLAEKNGDVKKLREYARHFRGKGRYAFEASPNYTKRHLFKGVPERIHRLLPNVKLIYLLRDPIARAVSNYVHNYAVGRENRPFSEVIRDENNTYILSGRYFFQLEAYLKRFDERRILLLESEALREETAGSVERVFEFLEIPPLYDASLLKKRMHQSENKARLSSVDRFVHRYVKQPQLRGAVKRAVPNFLRAPTPFEKPRVTEEDRLYLAEQFREDVEKLRRFSGMKFSRWSL